MAARDLLEGNAQHCAGPVHAHHGADLGQEASTSSTLITCNLVLVHQHSSKLASDLQGDATFLEHLLIAQGSVRHHTSFSPLFGGSGLEPCYFFLHGYS